MGYPAHCPWGNKPGLALPLGHDTSKGKPGAVRLDQSPEKQKWRLHWHSWSILYFEVINITYNKIMLFPYNPLAFSCLHGDRHRLLFQLLCWTAYLLQLLSPAKSHCFLRYAPHPHKWDLFSLRVWPYIWLCWNMHSNEDTFLSDPDLCPSSFLSSLFSFYFLQILSAMI